MPHARRAAAGAVLALALALAGALALPLAAADAPKSTAPEKITSVEGITEYRLANGLRVLLFPDPSKPTITVNVTYLVGSRNEGYGETGMAHLLEHLVFKGTPRHPNIPQELTAHGTRPNGTTSFDRTNYFETFDATDANLEWALDLEADRMVNSFIAKKDLDSEMTVVRNEFEAGENQPSVILFKRMLASAFHEHGYGHLPIGSRSDIENVPIERLQAFYRNYYQPDNAVLLVAGKFDEKKTLDLVQKFFGAIPRPARTLYPTYTLDPPQDGERAVTIRRVGDVQLVAAAYHIPSGSDADAPGLDLLAFALADTPSGRLHRSLVEAKKASSIFGFAWGLKEPGLAIFGAELRQDQNLDEAREILLKTVESAAANPPAKEEVERARTQLVKQIDLALNDSSQVGLRLSEWIAKGDWRLFFLYRDRLKAYPVEGVARVAAAYLKPTNRTLATFIPTAKPDKAEVPPPADVAAMLKGYTGAAAVAAGEAFDPSPANIETRTRRSTLPSGMKVALLPKKTRGASVRGTIVLHFRDLASLTGKSAVSDLTADMLERGTAKKTRQEIQDTIDRLKARIRVAGGGSRTAVSIETTRENLPKVLDLVAEILKEPSFPASELEILRQENLANIDQMKTEPQAVAGTAFGRHMRPYPKDDPRYTPTPDESLAAYKAATLDAVKAFWKESYGASNAEAVLVGDFDEAAVHAQLSALFGAWKSPSPYTRVPDLYRDVPADSLRLETPDKANAVFFAGQNLPLKDEDPDYPALALANHMFGGGFLNSRLAVRIRQKDGLSYGVGSSLDPGTLDASGSFTVFAIHAPQNTARLEAAVREEIERARKEGFTAEELAAARSGWLQGRQVSRSQDGELAGLLQRRVFQGRTIAWDAELEKKVSALAADQVTAAFRKWIDPAKVSVVRAGDFANVKADAKK
ncbi:MAG TPA: pitrilysin family protein [Thermoanaerobaculia bacterium]|nr:pitrilysin family protein [Thermoanaerobaculia bacterium]